MTIDRLHLQDHKDKPAHVSGQQANVVCSLVGAGSYGSPKALEDKACVAQDRRAGACVVRRRWESLMVSMETRFAGHAFVVGCP
jgi:hypothetical protein